MSSSLKDSPPSITETEASPISLIFIKKLALLPWPFVVNCPVSYSPENLDTFASLILSTLFIPPKPSLFISTVCIVFCI